MKELELQNDCLGVDIGGVLIDRVADGTDTSFFSKRYLETPAVPDGFETLARLARERFGERVHIVSKCGPTIQAKSKEWLAHRRFTEITGVPLERVHFCRTREEKAPICKRLLVTHFIDDRYDVLSYVKTVPYRFLFQPREDDLARAAREPLAGLKVVQSWAEIAEALLDQAPPRS
jgi:hypothetical protein